MKEDKGPQNYDSIMNREGVSGILRYLHDHGEAKNVDLKTVIRNHYRLRDTMPLLSDRSCFLIRLWLCVRSSRVGHVPFLRCLVRSTLEPWSRLQRTTAPGSRRGELARPGSGSLALGGSVGRR